MKRQNFEGSKRFQKRPVSRISKYNKKVANTLKKTSSKTNTDLITKKMNDSESSSDESKWTVVTNKALRKKKARITLKKLFPNLQGPSVKTSTKAHYKIF